MTVPCEVPLVSTMCDYWGVELPKIKVGMQSELRGKECSVLPGTALECRWHLTNDIQAKKVFDSEIELFQVPFNCWI